ncbi:hypothetical protein VNO80_09453 [Phaseolus coccineus]|uniref:Uncharacterized protein n=1 Tax=Phaseolus coccineus TaxID=3886 RepID=A0AAN9N6U2_PHACN
MGARRGINVVNVWENIQIQCWRRNKACPLCNPSKRTTHSISTPRIQSVSDPLIRYTPTATVAATLDIAHTQHPFRISIFLRPFVSLVIHKCDWFYYRIGRGLELSREKLPNMVKVSPLQRGKTQAGCQKQENTPLIRVDSMNHEQKARKCMGNSSTVSGAMGQ